MNKFPLTRTVLETLFLVSSCFKRIKRSICRRQLKIFFAFDDQRGFCYLPATKKNILLQTWVECAEPYIWPMMKHHFLCLYRISTSPGSFLFSARTAHSVSFMTKSGQSSTPFMLLTTTPTRCAENKVGIIYSEDGKLFFLPHHGVLKIICAKENLHEVFKTSTRSRDRLSLNELLHVGPKLQKDLARIQRFVFATDIKETYRQIVFAPEDHQYQQI